MLHSQDEGDMDDLNDNGRAIALNCTRLLDPVRPVRTLVVGRWFLATQFAVSSWATEEGAGLIAKHIVTVDSLTQEGVGMLRVVIFRLAIWIGRWPR